MNVVLAILIFCASLGLIIFGGNKLVDSAVAVAKKFKIPTAIIGATIVSIGTTIPELLVSIFSVSSNASDLAVGNALGSVIFNSCIIGGILLCFARMFTKGFNYEYLLLIGTLVVTFILSLNGRLGILASILLLIIFVAFMSINIIKAVKQKSQEEDNNQTIDSSKSVWFYVLFFLIGAVCVGGGSYFLVESAKYLARLAGMSEIFIGLTIVAFGTSLPELVTSISAIKKNEAGLSFGNIVGANVLNSTLLVGLTGVLSGGLAITAETLYITIPVAIASVIIMLVPTLIYHKTFKWQGFTLLSLYILYYIYLMLNAFGVLVIF